MDLFTWKSGEPFGASPQLVFWQTNCYDAAFSHTVIMSVITILVYGSITHARSHSPWWLTILGVKYVGHEHADHLIQCIKETYELTKDLTRDLYCGIKLDWDYNARTLNILMPGYITKLLQKYKHCVPPKPQHCPYSPLPRQYGAKAQAPIPIDISPKLSHKKIKERQ
jgi:hypothetical protein